MDSAHPKPRCGGNLILDALMDAPDALSDRCTIPGCTTPYDRLENHHIVNRSQGGKDGPRRTLCWNHHEPVRLHLLHLRWDKVYGHRYLLTEVATRYEYALLMDGWRTL